MAPAMKNMIISSFAIIAILFAITADGGDASTEAVTELSGKVGVGIPEDSRGLTSMGAGDQKTTTRTSKRVEKEAGEMQRVEEKKKTAAAAAAPANYDVSMSGSRCSGKQNRVQCYEECLRGSKDKDWNCVYACFRNSC